ncbi:nuclear pore complex protein Nup214 isoform X1 [Oncorhynchus mykiss]|uniref:Nuclear pore complex protein Nup214 n=1 Tax=Oncorhynchus mykiss TaxID=8022 RepID=A0A8C7SG02_ONCMY|nr:nuclear pore complex protein Nup214 isoform X1 [Oncorhynchus mykiss]
MSEDPDSPPEREMKDFQFRQMKKTRVFDSPDDLPKDRSSLLAISNKFGLTFVGLDRKIKVYLTGDILASDKVDGNSNEIVEGIAALADVHVELPVHNLGLSSDELTLSVSGMSEASGLSLAFYDVRTFINKARLQKLPFATLQLRAGLGIIVQDLKWNPVQVSMLATCLSDGSMMVLEVTDSVTVQAQLPATAGITCVCWSPKGKQVAAGKMNATVSQYTPGLQEKKVIPCPSFYSSDNPVKVLDVQWLSTFVFAVAYAAADGCPETPPELVVISLPTKTEKREERYLNFNDPVYGTCTERQHHYFLSHIEDWDVVLAASAASIEVSVIAKQEDKTNWELWLLEDASRGELPVSQNNDDTLPLGLAIDYTSQQDIHITDEKTLPPAPTLLLLSTDGVLCPFSLLNFNPGVKQLVAAPTSLALDGERLPPAGSAAPPPPYPTSSLPSAPAAFPPLRLPLATTPNPPPPVSSPASVSLFTAAPAPASSSGFSFSMPPSSTAPPAFFLGGSTAFSASAALGTSGSFSFSSKPLTETPAAASAFSVSAPKLPVVEMAPVPAPTPKPIPQRLATASPIMVLRGTPEPTTPAVKMNLNDRFLAVDTLAAAPASQPFSFNSTPKAAFSEPSSHSAPLPIVTKSAAMPGPVQTGTPSTVVQKCSPATQTSAPTPQAALSVNALERQLQQRKGSDPVMAGILEEIAHFQKELDDLKARSHKADFRVGTTEEMKELRKESEDFHVFTLEIKDTTESLHGDISTLKTTMLEGFAGAEDAKAQSELNRHRGYLQLLYKKPLDPRSEDQLKEIRRLYQYVKFAVEDVNDVLDLEWEKHLEKKKKQKHMIVPEREALFTALANNLDIINQQKQRLDTLVKDLHALRLYNKTAAWSTPAPSQPCHPAATTPTEQGLDNELESLRDALLKASLETIPKTTSKSPAKMSPMKQSQLRNFLSKRQTPPVRSTAPVNLSRSAFLSPKYYADLDDVSSTSSLSQALDPEYSHYFAEEEPEPEPEPAPLPMLPLSMPRHPTVVRTPSIAPGFGAIQSTPFSKVRQGLGLSPIMSPVPTNKINMGGADSTALATKTVKHGAPPTEKATPVPLPAQQAAAKAAFLRQMANQKPAVSGSLTESTLKTVPQVVNVQELNDKGLPPPVSTVISSSVPAPVGQVVQQVLATVANTNQAKRNSTQGILKVSAESVCSASPQGFVFGGPPKADALVSLPPSSSAPSLGEQSSKAFSFIAASAGGFSFSSAPQGAPPVKDVSKFSFSSAGGSTGKMMFGSSTGEEPFSFTPKSTSPALGANGSPTPLPSMSGEPVKPTSITPTLRVEPQAPKVVGGETLGSFSGLRVGQGDEEKPSAAAFSFGQPDNGAALGLGTGAAQFSFGLALQQGKLAEAAFGEADSTLTDLSKAAFKPPEPAALSVTKPVFSTSAATSFSSLLAAPLSSPSTTLENEHHKTPTTPADSTPPLEPSSSQPSPSVSPPIAEPEVTTSPESSVTPTPTIPEKAPTPPAPPATSTTSFPPASITPPAQAAPSTTPEPVHESMPAPEASPPAITPTPEAPPLAYPAPSSDKPGSIFTQPPAVIAVSTTVAVTSLTPVINTAAPASTTPTNSNSVFGQPAPASAAAGGFGSTGFGAPLATGAAAGFGKPVFGQTVGGFGQPAANVAGGFGFGQSAFGANPGFGQPAVASPAAVASTAASGGGLFGALSVSNASGFSFGSPSASTASSTGTGLFGQPSATPAFGQQSAGFGQGSAFGSNTTTTSSTGFSFGQTAAFGSSSTNSVFGQQPSGGSVFGQQPSSGVGLFGSSSATVAGSQQAGGGFFSGLGGKPSEDAANKNPFGTTAATGGFSQPNQTGGPTLFGNSGAKTFGFGSPASAFGGGEQTASGTFSTGGGSVAAQGFGSFSTPAKQTGGFGSAPVFGSPPAFGGSPAFGGAAAFGSAPSFSSPMGSSASKVFGEGTAAANVGGFGFASTQQSTPSFGALANQSAPSFGNLAQQQQGSGFGAPQLSGFSAFGQQGGGGFGSAGGFGSNQPRWPGQQ